MNTAVILVLLSLLFTALNDFVFKVFAGKKRSLGGFIAVNGAVACLLMMFFPIDMGPSLKVTVGWGILGGLMSVSANILLIEAMARQSAGLCSTIYRMNMVLVILGACLFLGESITGYHQTLALLCALLAIVLFMPLGQKNTDFNWQGFFLALAACFLRSLMGLFYKAALNQGVTANAMCIITDCCWVVVGLAYVLIRERQWGWLKDKSVLGLGCIGGLLIGSIILCMAGSLYLGDASKVLPMAQMSFLVTFLLSVAFLHEKADLRKVLAVICGVCTVILLAMKL